ncbi:MAG: hypothetical protein JNM14_04195 [Ferruginibacter sp.]|nr:hypothetical protein [Ferruginibacter sp.]
MKKLVLLLMFSGSIVFAATAQTTKAKVKNPNQATNTQTGKTKVKQTTTNGNIKLDDLKDPFDTNKVKAAQPVRLKN